MPDKAELCQIYRCSFCRKPFMRKSSATRHEKYHCKNEYSPRVQNCAHEWGESWSPFYQSDGSQRWQPETSFCKICGVESWDLTDAEESIKKAQHKEKL